MWWGEGGEGRTHSIRADLRVAGLVRVSTLAARSKLQVVGEVMIREHDLDAKSMLNSDYLFQIREVGTYLLVCACRCGVDVGCLFGEIDSYYQEGKVN